MAAPPARPTINVPPVDAPKSILTLIKSHPEFIPQPDLFVAPLETFQDLTLVCSENKQIAVEKRILMQHSEVFYKMLTQPMREKEQNRIELREFSAITVSFFVSLLYKIEQIGLNKYHWDHFTGEGRGDTEETVALFKETLRFAYMYDFKNVLHICKIIMINCLPATWFFQYDEQFSLGLRKELLQNWIRMTLQKRKLPPFEDLSIYGDLLVMICSEKFQETTELSFALCESLVESKLDPTPLVRANLPLPMTGHMARFVENIPDVNLKYNLLASTIYGATYKKDTPEKKIYTLYHKEKTQEIKRILEEKDTTTSENNPKKNKK